MRSISKKWLLVPAAALLAACGGDEKAQPALDGALSNDLSLAQQAQPYAPQQFVSPMEQGYGMQPGYYPPPMYPQAPYGYHPMPPQPVYSAPAPQRVRTVYRTASTSGSVAVRREPKRHTKRDAAIGAVAGAAIGAATSRDKLKGGLIGAAIGGVAGAIIGHTIDVER